MSNPTCNGCGRFCHWEPEYEIYSCENCGGREAEGPAQKVFGGPGYRRDWDAPDSPAPDPALRSDTRKTRRKARP
jgi:hypothetical protein